MIIKLLLLTLFCVGLSGISEASAHQGQFTPKDKTWAVQSYQAFEQGPFSASVHGIFREITRYRSISVSYEDITVASSYLRDGGLTVQLHIEKNRDGSPRRAPLAVVLNPLFSESTFAQMNRFIEFFGSRGYHVVVFQNSFSDAVTKQAPVFFPGDLRAESAMHREAVQSVVQRIGAANVTEINLVGLSYGAFLAAVIQADDAAAAQPQFTGPAFLLNPPYDILNSARNLDRFGRESQDTGLLGCALSAPALFYNAFLVDDNQRIHMNEPCAKAFLSVVGFRGRLKHMLSSLNKSMNLGLSSEHLDSLSFETYVSQLAQVKVDGGMSELQYWMRRAQDHGYDSFLVLGSADDPINERFDFATSQAGTIDPNHWLEMKTGGHTGLRSARNLDPNCQSRNWLNCFLERIYSQN
ncbi:hypothetical protein WDW37_15485 [Bdellovibrionota bacterium FG-1]